MPSFSENADPPRRLESYALTSSLPVLRIAPDNRALASASGSVLEFEMCRKFIMGTPGVTFALRGACAGFVLLAECSHADATDTQRPLDAREPQPEASSGMDAAASAAEPPGRDPLAGPDAGAAVPGEAGAGSADGGAPGDAARGCPPIPVCNATPPDPGVARGFVHASSRFAASLGNPNHRGRDSFFGPGEAQWIIGKFAYGLLDDDIQGEEVDIYLLRGCAGQWERLGSALTTEDDSHDPVEGVADSGGRVFFQIPAAKLLGSGRHRVHMVVAGDRSSADAYIEVIAPGTPVVVSDVDGTLTTSENEEFSALLSGGTPVMNPEASNLMAALAAKGYRPLYLTARPELLLERTREFLSGHGFPGGIVHTTLTLSGALGDAAASFKTAELADLAAKGARVAYAFGNTESDADAYATVAGAERIFFQFSDDEHGGRRIESYAELLDEVRALPDLCP